MDKIELKKVMKNAMDGGTLLTPKHDPEHLSTTYSNYRTVLTHELANGLEEFIESGDYKARQYCNNSTPNSPNYIEIEPSQNSTYSVTASGIQRNSLIPSHAVDRIVLVSGTNQGWHIYGKESQVIKNKENNGIISYLADII